MSYHKSDREKYVLAKTTLEGATIESVTLFFQALFEAKRLDGTLERQELERIKRRALREASDAVRRRIRDATDSRRTRRARDELAYRGRSGHRSHTSGDRVDRRRVVDDDRNDDSRHHHRGPAKRPRDERSHRDRGDRGRRHNQPNDGKSTAGRSGSARSSSERPCEKHSSPGRPAKHSWAECSANPANARAASTRRAEAYYADDGRSGDEDSRSAGHRSDSASDGEYSRRSHDDDEDSRDGDENYAVAIEETVPRKRAKHESTPAKPAVPKKRITIAMSDDDDDWDDVSAKLGELAESFVVFPPPGKGDKIHKHHLRPAKKTKRKKPVESVGPLDDLADTP